MRQRLKIYKLSPPFHEYTGSLFILMEEEGKCKYYVPDIGQECEFDRLRYESCSFTSFKLARCEFKDRYKLMEIERI